MKDTLGSLENKPRDGVEVPFSSTLKPDPATATVASGLGIEETVSRSNNY